MPYIKEILLVFVGGGLGSALRFSIGKVLVFSDQNWPFGTLVSNFLACLLLGAFTAFLQLQVKDAGWEKAFWMIGFCGGLSTFSTLIYELNVQGMFSLKSFLYLSSSVILGLLVFWGSFKIIHYLGS